VLAQAPVPSALSAPHLQQADQLVDHLSGVRDNVYSERLTYINWDSGSCSARTDCSSFITLLLKHTYAWSRTNVEAIFHSSRPKAANYHDAIVAERGFKRIVDVSDLRPGDILAVKYTDHHVSANGVQDSGHVMLVSAPPVAIDSTKPLVAGTSQYCVTIIDSAMSGHGPADTRAKPDNSGFTGGIGRGVIRLYADRSGSIVGYTWSNTPESVYYAGPPRDLVAGRLIVPVSTSP
jgi:hypothetical protein